MRRSGAARGAGLAALALFVCGPALAQAPGAATNASICVRSAAACLDYGHPNHRNCGSRGGPGCRKANGQCAAWRDGFTPACRRPR